MKNKKAFFFDLGQTVIRFSWGEAIKRLAAETAAPDAKHFRSIEALSHAIGYIEYELGNVSTETFFTRFSDIVGFRGGLDCLMHIYNDIFTAWPEREALLEKLRPKYRLAAVSNTSEAHILHVEQHFSVLNFFEEKIYSFDVHTRKPDRPIYEIALQKLGVSPEESVFVDDLEANCHTAASMGFETVHLLNDTDLEQEFIKRGWLQS